MKTELVRKLSITLFFFMPVSQFAFAIPASRHTADTVYFDAHVVTIDDKKPYADAIAIKDGKIVAVGTKAEIETWIGPPTKRYDLDGKTIVPGFIDGHGHMVNVGVQAIAANLLPPPDGGVDSIASLQKVLKNWVDSSPVPKKYNIIIGFGYDDSQLKEKRHPTKEELDMVSKDIPVMAFHQSGHIRAYNSKALEMAGITSETQDPVGGVIRRKHGSKEPTGVFEETAMLLVDMKVLPKIGNEELLNLALAGQDLYTKFGHTTAQEGLAISPFMTALDLAAKSKKLQIDVVAFPPIMFPGIEDAMASPYYGNTYQNHLRIGGVKLVLDGSPQGKTAWLTKPYYKVPEGNYKNYAGYASMKDEDAYHYINLAFAKNWNIITHTNGDAAIDQLIKGVELAREKNPKSKSLATMIHGQTLREDQIPQLKTLKIFPSLFPMHTFYWGDWHRDSVLGPERAANISPTGWLVKADIPFSSHHDAPVAFPDMIRVLSATVNRTTRSGKVLGPDQRVDTLTGLKSITLWPAMQYKEEDKKGSIQVGKLADLVILSENPITVAPSRIADIKVLQTIKEGNVIYSLKESKSVKTPSCLETPACFEKFAKAQESNGILAVNFPNYPLSHSH